MDMTPQIRIRFAATLSIDHSIPIPFASNWAILNGDLILPYGFMMRTIATVEVLTWSKWGFRGPTLYPMCLTC